MKNSELFIPVVLGTARKDRESANAAEFIKKQTHEYGLKTELVDVREVMTEATIPAWIGDNEATSWRDTAGRMDGLIIVAPEYNHGYPGELKLLIDMAYKEYQHKPVAICGVSGGGLGGVRMVEKLIPVMVELQMVPIRNVVFFSNVKELFNDAGEITNDAYKERTTTMLDNLTWYAKALKTARENT
jgi:NAD(P)H-dependent FMN reductase